MASAEVDGLGAWIRDWRHDRRWTQERLAHAMGYEVSYIAKIERGARPPSRPFVARLAEIVGKTKEELLQLSRRRSAKVRLPTTIGPILGRAAEVAEIGAILRGPARCVTLVGAPGIGKTSLALEVAWELAAEFRHGACFVPLSDLADPASVLPAIVNGLGLVERGSAPPEALLADALRTREMLLVLDNFEHLLAARGLVEQLVTDAPLLRVLITSREALNVAAETEYRVPTLAFPDPSRELEGRPQDYPSVEVFLTRSRRAKPDFALTEANLPAVVEICARLDGLPLGITLTAAASRLLSPADIAKSLRERLELPTYGEGDPLAHGRLAAALDWSWDLLAPAEQCLLARLSVFAGSFGLAAVEAVCAEDGRAEDGRGAQDVLEGLANLESKHLVETARTAADESRFSLLETIRRYSLERLRQHGAVEDLGARHCAHYVALARAAEPHLTGGEHQARWFSLLEEDFPNLAAAFAWALAREPGTALQLSASLGRFFLMRRTSEGRRWLGEAMARTGCESLLQVQALNVAAYLARSQGFLDVAEGHLREAHCAVTRLGWIDDAAAKRELAVAVINQGIIEQERGRYGLAEARFDEAFVLYREMGDERGISHCVNCQGVLALRRDDLEAASRLFFEALTVFRALTDRWSIAITATNLGWIAEVQGELAEAQNWYEETRQMWESVSDEHGVARSRADLGRVARRQRDSARAAQQLESALVAFHRLGDRRLAAACLVELAAVAVQRRRRELGVRLLGAAEGIRNSLATPAWPDEAALEAEVGDALRRAMGDAAVARIWSMGRALSLEDALALVESGTWPPPRLARSHAASLRA